ncbi:hypothetical protein [Roseomonas sp. USHLN139]|uniref:hypothetical protein n=1 Tax=Roseomonas sp. USHLN139 TaxID=3081298 RepID=UPI003B01A46C
MAFLVAPFDRQRQQEFLVMLAADLLDSAPSYVARRMEQLRAVTLVHDHPQVALQRYNKYVETSLFLPSGGLRRLRDASPPAVWAKELQQSQRGPLLAAGRLLLFIVQMAVHHPKLTASTKRALAVLDAWGQAGGPVPTQRQMPLIWSQCGGVAPVYAAMILAQEYWLQHGLTPEHAIRQKRLFRQLLSWMAWLRDFSLQHKPLGASAPLLLSEKVVRLPAGLAPEQPPIGPLPPHLLQAAMRYRAPVPQS